MIRDAWEADLDAIVGIDNAAIPGRVATATTAEQRRRAEVEVLLALVFLTPAFPHWDRPCRARRSPPPGRSR